jgi:DNA-binding NtrC family response regulator
MKPRILLTEDDTVAGELFAEVLEEQGYDVDRVESGEAALQHLQASRYDLLLVDVQLPGRSGLEVTRLSRRQYPELPVVVMTAFGSMETAIEAIQDGAFDYASKPINIDELKQVVLRALAQQRTAAPPPHARDGNGAANGHTPAQAAAAEATAEADASRALGTLIGRSAVMVDVYKTVARVAPTKSTALILGESGTGKELVARAIHEHSPRARHRFLAIDCGALPETLLESELFGHVRGAFTGAVADKKGLFEEADGNTCFLDEIGDVSPALQAKLLRVLQEGEVRRIGSQRWIKVDTRIVAATNKDLAALVRDGTFREDLYYRLNVVTITLPPLRQRAEDIPALATHFLRRCARLNGTGMTSIADSAMQLLRAYEWPGNIRELENTIARAATLSNQRVLTVDDLPPAIRDARSAQMIARVAAGVNGVFADAPSLEEVKRRYIRHVIVSTRGNLSRAAAILDVDRRSLYRMIERLEIDVPGRE